MKAYRGTKFNGRSLVGTMKGYNIYVLLIFAISLSTTLAFSANAGERQHRYFPRLFKPETCIGKINWTEVGFDDGSAGIESSYFEVYEKRCAARFRSPDKAAYFRAYNVGIQSFCDPQNIYQLARSGAVAIGACEETPEIVSAVQRGFANLLK